jgi:hypothetical protein
MSYPNSSAVAAGDATLASHYNNLRSDALFAGHAAADAAPLATLLESYESRLKIIRSGTTLLQVSADADAPVSLMIDGFMVQAVSNVVLAAGSAPSGVASAYYVFANRSAGSTSFTLSVSTSPTEAANQRRIGRFYWNGTMIIKDSIQTELAVLIADLLYKIDPHVCDGRLTLSTGVPVPTSDVASSATVYFAPYIGSRVALYVVGFGWRLYTFSELSISIASVAADKNLDVFIYDNAGTLTLETVEWSNNTLRATALIRQDGVLVKTGELNKRYLGTVRTYALGASCDTMLERFVWNYYNRVPRFLRVVEETDSWTYAVAGVWRNLNNSAANKVEFVIGVDESLLLMQLHVLCENSGNNGHAVSLCLDNNNTTSCVILLGYYLIGTTYNKTWKSAYYCDHPGLGYHYLQCVEISGGGTTTFYGDAGTSPYVKSSGFGWLAA